MIVQKPICIQRRHGRQDDKWHRAVQYLVTCVSFDVADWLPTSNVHHMYDIQAKPQRLHDYKLFLELPDDATLTVHWYYLCEECYPIERFVPGFVTVRPYDWSDDAKQVFWPTKRKKRKLAALMPPGIHDDDEPDEAFVDAPAAECDELPEDMHEAEDHLGEHVPDALEDLHYKVMRICMHTRVCINVYARVPLQLEVYIYTLRCTHITFELSSNVPVRVIDLLRS